MSLHSTLRITLLLLLLAPLAACTQPKDTLPTLHIVHTWNDLLAQPIVGTGGQAVHVGIEALTCPAHTGILVYCIPVDQSGSRKITERPHNPLGPVAVKVVPLDQPRNDVKYALEKVNEQMTDREKPVFFAAAATVETPGRYEVEVIDPNDKILAKTTIEATKSQGSPWLTFDALELSKEPDANRYALSTIAARPHWDGTVPMNQSNDLPPFFAQKEFPNLNVSVHAGLVTVKIDQDIEEYPTENWLIRWWVNGKPVLAQFGPRKSPRMMRTDARRMLNTGEFMTFSFHLHVDLKKLGATPADRLEFQLLYCRDRIEFTGDEELSMMKSFNPNAAPACLSKRLPWQP